MENENGYQGYALTLRHVFKRSRRGALARSDVRQSCGE